MRQAALAAPRKAPARGWQRGRAGTGTGRVGPSSRTGARWALRAAGEGCRRKQKCRNERVTLVINADGRMGLNFSVGSSALLPPPFSCLGVLILREHGTLQRSSDFLWKSVKSLPNISYRFYRYIKQQ